MDLPTLAASESQNGDVEIIQTKSEEAHATDYPLWPGFGQEYILGLNAEKGSNSISDLRP
jgi:hypothetical protein